MEVIKRVHQTNTLNPTRFHITDGPDKLSRGDDCVFLSDTLKKLSRWCRWRFHHFCGQKRTADQILLKCPCDVPAPGHLHEALCRPHAHPSSAAATHGQDLPSTPYIYTFHLHLASRVSPAYPSSAAATLVQDLPSTPSIYTLHHVSAQLRSHNGGRGSVHFVYSLWAR